MAKKIKKDNEIIIQLLRDEFPELKRMEMYLLEFDMEQRNQGLTVRDKWRTELGWRLEWLKKRKLIN